MESNNYFDLDTRKLLSLEGQTWAHFDYGLDEDSSSNDVEDGKSDTSSTITPTTNGGMSYNSFGVSDTMKLKEEDMYLFGLCPAYDPFFLAVCEYCGQVIKPQALAKHIELRHRSFPNDSNHGKPFNLVHDQLDESCNAQSTINLIPGIKGISHRVGSNGDTNQLGDNMNTHLIVSGRSTLFSSDNKNDSNKHILLEAIPPGPGPGSSPLSFGGQPNNQIIAGGLAGTSHKNSSSQPNQSGINSPFNNIVALSSSSSSASSPNSSNSSQTLMSSSNLLTNTRYGSSQLNTNKTDVAAGGNIAGSNGAKTKSSNNLLVKKASVRGKLLPCKDREYDADKHCGVKIGDMDKPCTRSLTCKTHSLTLRRSVADRSKNFDDLLAEHRATKEAALRAAGIEVKPTKQQLKQRELEAKRQLLLQQTKPQQQSHQPQQKQQKQQHAPLLQQKLDQSNSHQIKSHSKQYNTHNQSQPQQPHHHLRHHSNPSLELPLPISSTHSHHSQHSQLKEINSTVSQSTSQNSITGRQDKHSPILARQLNETIDAKVDSKSSTPPPIQHQPQLPPTVPSTSSPIPTTYSNNQLDKPKFIEVDGCLYLPNPPKPMALCNFNARQISIEPLNCDQDDNPCNLSSRLFTRRRDLTYSALTIFRTRSKTDGRPNNQKLLSLLNSN